MKLSPKEKEVISLHESGLTQKQIAKQLHIAVGNVQLKLRNAKEKMRANDEQPFFAELSRRTHLILLRAGISDKESLEHALESGFKHRVLGDSSVLELSDLLQRPIYKGSDGRYWLSPECGNQVGVKKTQLDPLYKLRKDELIAEIKRLKALLKEEEALPKGDSE